MRTLARCHGEFGHATAEQLRQFALVVAELRRGGACTDDVARAIGRAAGAGPVQRRRRERQADEVHAVMQQRQHHRQQRRFLAAVHRRGRREDRGGLAVERAVEPERTGAVEKILQRRGHVAEPGRAAEQQAVALDQVVVRGVGRPGGRHGRLAVASVTGETGGTVRSRAVDAVDRFDPADDVAGKFGRRAVAGVVENEYFRHEIAPARW